MDLNRLSYFIDLDRYPLHDPQHPRYQETLNEARSALQRDGCYVLKSIIRKDALWEMQQEAISLEEQAHYTTKQVNVYFSEDDPSFPSDHPRRFFMNRSNGFVSGDKFQKDSKIKELYHSEILKEFIGTCMQTPIFHYADPIASLTINVNKPGDRFSWHFDTNEFTVTLLLLDAEEGGIFQYVPNIRNKNDECYDDVLKLLKGDRSRVKELRLYEGDLQLFKGRYSLHRATRVHGQKTRDLVVFTYTEKEDVIGAEYRSMELYGMISDRHKETRIRSDALTD